MCPGINRSVTHISIKDSFKYRRISLSRATIYTGEEQADPSLAADELGMTCHSERSAAKRTICFGLRALGHAMPLWLELTGEVQMRNKAVKLLKEKNRAG
jgi:hypothetical protein